GRRPRERRHRLPERTRPVSKIQVTDNPRTGTGYPRLAVGPARRAYEADKRRPTRIERVIRSEFPMDGGTPIAWLASGEWTAVYERLERLAESDPEALEEMNRLIEATKMPVISLDEYDDNGPVKPDFNS